MTDVERLARALHDSTWACPTGQTVPNWCDPRRGELFHVSQAVSIAAEYAPASEGRLDVERLARAMSMVAGRLGVHSACLVDDDAEAIAAEYARLR